MRNATSNRFFKCDQTGLLCALVVALFACLCSVNLWAGQSSQKASDIRVLVDVSGSMKKNDPRNLRKPAMDLLLQLFPQESKAGVWTFGRYVNMLINHDSVNDQWREEAITQTRLINSIALHTNIGLALEKANYDADAKRFPSAQNYTKAVILLTDGVVDIDSDPAVNEAERKRILEQILPAYQRAGVKIHSVALSTNADVELLEALSEATGGLFAVAEDAQDLNKIFLRAFENSAAVDRVPLQDNRFIVDSSVEEFTALVFKRADSAFTQLLSPQGDKYSAQTNSNKVRWFSSTDYDLITIQQPVEGEWRINAELDPENRVTVVSNLRLELDPLPNTVYDTRAHELVASVSSSGELLRDKKFVELLKVELEADLNGQALPSKSITAQDPSRAVYHQPLTMLSQPGDYNILVSVDGQTFKRERKIGLQLKPGFSSEIKSKDENGFLEVTVKAQDPALFNAEVKIEALLILPNGDERAIALEKTDSASWRYTANGLTSGDYQLRLEASGEIATEPFNLQLGNTLFSLNVPGSPAVEVAPLVKETVVEETLLEPVEAPEPVTAQAVTEKKPESKETKEIESKDESMPRWVLYAALGLGNVLLLAGLFFAYKKLVADDHTPTELEEAKGAPAEQTAEQSPPEQSETAEEPAAQDETEQKEIAEQKGEEKGEEVELAESERVESQQIETPEKEADPQQQADEPEAEIDVAIDLDAMLDVDDTEVAQPSAEQAQPDELDAELDAMLSELDAQTADDSEAQSEAQSEAENEIEGDAGNEATSDDQQAESVEEEIDVSLDLDEEFDLSTDLEEDKKQQK